VDTVVDLRGLIAGLVCADLGLTHAEAFAALLDVPDDELRLDEEQLRRGGDTAAGGTGAGEVPELAAATIVYCTERLSVIDTPVAAPQLIARAIAAAAAATASVAPNTRAAEPRDTDESTDAACVTTAGVPVIEYSLRSLHFNDAIDLVQSCALVEKTSVMAITAGASDGSTTTTTTTSRVMHTAPPPMWGATGTAVQGLSLALPFREAAASFGARGASSSMCAPLRSVAVLGAGACTLPAHLHAAFPDVAFVAVELSEDVVLIARDHFHVDALEASGRFLLHRGCAFEWAERQREAHGFNQALNNVRIQDGHQSNNSRTAKWDVVVVDLQFGPAVCGGLIAPPARALTSESLHLFDSLLAQGGAIVFNSVGTEQSVRDAARAAKASALCWVPGSAPGDDKDVVVHAVFFRLHGGHGGSHDRNVDAARVRLQLDSLPRLVDDADAWLANWECLSTCS
jgi:hypothetical protein